MPESIIKGTKEQMIKTLETLKKELMRVRTGRASPSLLEGIRVEYYGSLAPLSQVASVSVPESRQITIQPWDPKVIGDIEKAILKSDLGLTPANDGKLIRITIPSPTEERRKELVKVVRKIGEEAKVAVRNLRRDANEALKDRKKEKGLPEDELFKRQEEVQKITDDFIGKIDQTIAEKEQEILKF
jgi:ribosome recycling factor